MVTAGFAGICFLILYVSMDVYGVVMPFLPLAYLGRGGGEGGDGDSDGDGDADADMDTDWGVDGDGEGYGD